MGGARAVTILASADGHRALMLLAALTTGLGCNPFGPRPEAFVIRVDSISAPLSVGPTENLIIRFSGTIGPSGCYRLTEVTTGRTQTHFEVRFNGEFRNVLCTQDPSHLAHDIELAPPFRDPFVIRALQPSGPALERSVRIQQ